MQNEVEVLKEELALAKTENDSVRLQLNNVMLLLKMEMADSGKLPKVNVSNTYLAVDRFVLLN